MRTTVPVVLAVLIAMSGIAAAGGVSIMKAYTPISPMKQTSSPATTSSTASPPNSAALQQQPSTVKLTQQPPTNQTCSGDDCEHEQGDSD